MKLNFTKLYIITQLIVLVVTNIVSLPTYFELGVFGFWAAYLKFNLFTQAVLHISFGFVYLSLRKGIETKW